MSVSEINFINYKQSYNPNKESREHFFGPGIWTMNALLRGLSYGHQIVVGLVHDDCNHPLLNTDSSNSFDCFKKLLDILTADNVFNERMRGNLNYSHHFSFTELLVANDIMLVYCLYTLYFILSTING